MAKNSKSVSVAQEIEREGICKECQREGLVYTDNNRCDTCDNDYRYCGICKTEQFRDDHCRHIFEDQYFEWMGSGIDCDQRLKKPLFRLFDLMPPTFAADLKTAIKSRRFHTWMIAPMIGGGGILEMHGMPDRDGKSMYLTYGDNMLDIGQGEFAEETADGYRWLASLYDNKTLKANKLTISWIDEWTNKQEVK